MITADSKLEIFEQFIVDTDLPKFSRRRERVKEREAGLLSMKWKGGLSVSGSDQENMSQHEFMATEDVEGFRLSGNSRFGPARGNMLVGETSRPPSIGRRFLVWLGLPPAMRTAGGDVHPEPKNAISVQDFFKNVKNSTEEIEIVEARVNGYLASLKKAKERGQRALMEQLGAGLVSTRAETQLVAIKQTKYLKEEKLVEFVKKAKKGLRLDWVKNFTRVIPDDIANKMLKCNDLEVFDNYVILHYDPQGKSRSETQAEKERRKDPVLFGVIQGRRNLYYIGDWVDEFCDLTLDQIADTIGKEAVQNIPKDFLIVT